MAELSGFPKLVFVEASNNVASIIAYIAALRGGHVVHLINPCKTDSNHELAKLFRPHVIIKCSGARWKLEYCGEEQFDIHQDLAVLLATSGSTGSQKLVKLSKDNIQSNTDSIAQYLKLTADDRAITSLKFHYSYGMSIVNSHLSVGGSLVLVDLPLQDSEFWNVMEQYEVTCFSGVPYHFEIIEKLGVDWNRFARLRYITQAGGRLSARLVKQYAKDSAANGREFYVMYGQTEAAPRISYLPPEYAEDNPDCIGVAVPGGNLSLVDDDNLPILEAGLAGELVYKGPNIMVGYALQPDDLATKEVIAKLYTGDIAIMKANGLFKIVGRKARFVKPFGLRLNLDDIEIYLNDSLKTGPFYLSGTDQKIVVFYVSKDVNEHNLLNNLSEYYSLPTTLFKLQRLDDIPLMANGKVNYKVLQNYGVAQASGFTSIVSFLGQFLIGSIREFFAIMLDFSDQWQSVEEIFRIQFPRADIRAEDSFISLGGDSLKHIEVSLCLEDYLGDLPDDWHDMSVKDLQSLKNGKHV